jgi:hypothetical protein
MLCSRIEREVAAWASLRRIQKQYNIVVRVIIVSTGVSRLTATDAIFAGGGGTQAPSGAASDPVCARTWTCRGRSAGRLTASQPTPHRRSRKNT